MTHPLPDEALETDIAIIAKKGKGKTYTAKGIVERLLDQKRRVVILDPMSVWWGLKSSPDGKSAGYAITVFGGPHQDMPLTVEMARPLARLVASSNFPIVLDMGDMRKSEWQRLVADFLDELYTANREALTLVLEEADVFAPQQPMKDQSVRVLGEVDRIARRGRAFGFRLISITQRPAKLNKDVLTQLSTLIMLGLTSPQDRDAIKAWVDGNADREAAKEVYSTLGDLKTGEAWIWAPDHGILTRQTLPRIKTLDTSATPKAGETRIQPQVLAQVDLTEIKAALQTEKPEEAKPVSKNIAAQIEAANQTGHAQGYQKGYEKGLADGETLGRKLASHAIGTQLRDMAGEYMGEATWIDPKPNNENLIEVSVVDHRAKNPYQDTPLSSIVRANVPAENTLTQCSARILDVVKSSHPVSISFNAAARRAGVSKRSSAFRKYRSEVLGHPDISERDGKLVWTGAPPIITMADEDPASAWAAKLPPSIGNMLKVICEYGPLEKTKVAEMAGVSPTSSGLSSGLRELISLELIVRDGDRYWPAEGMK